MVNNNEYTGGTVGSQKCTYGSLCNYSQGLMAQGPCGNKASSGNYVALDVNPRLPCDALIHGGPCCSGYPNIMHAYGKDCTNPQPKYKNVPCDGSDEAACGGNFKYGNDPYLTRNHKGNSRVGRV